MLGENILVVDGDRDSLRLTCSHLQTEGYRAKGVATGEEALVLVDQRTPDLVILEVELPGIDGFEVCRRIRAASAVPIIILTFLGTTENEVKGLDTGADDYVTKPLVFQELLARVKAVLRRSRLAETPLRQTKLALGDLQIDISARQVILRGRELSLTPTEYRLLCALAAQPGTLLTRDELLEVVWEPTYRGRHEILRVTLWRLRRKLETDPSNPLYIITKPGHGYMFMVQEDVPKVQIGSETGNESPILKSEQP